MTEYRAIYDQHGSIVKRVQYQPRDAQDGITWVTEQECDGIVAANRRDEEEAARGKHFRHAARIPLSVIERSMREGWFNDKAAWRRWMNDGENRAFRVWQGRV